METRLDAKRGNAAVSSLDRASRNPASLLNHELRRACYVAWLNRGANAACRSRTSFSVVGQSMHPSVIETP